MATTFIINETLKNNGTFPRESVATLCRLGCWSVKSGTWSFLKNIWTQVHPSIGKDLSISFPLEKSVYQLIEAMFTA